MRITMLILIYLLTKDILRKISITLNKNKKKLKIILILQIIREISQRIVVITSNSRIIAQMIGHFCLDNLNIFLKITISKNMIQLKQTEILQQTPTKSALTKINLGICLRKILRAIDPQSQIERRKVIDNLNNQTINNNSINSILNYNQLNSYSSNSNKTNSNNSSNSNNRNSKLSKIHSNNNNSSSNNSISLNLDNLDKRRIFLLLKIKMNHPIRIGEINQHPKPVMMFPNLINLLITLELNNYNNNLNNLSVRVNQIQLNNNKFLVNNNRINRFKNQCMLKI